MQQPGFAFSLKKMRGYNYLYIQRAFYRGKKRTVQSYSLGPAEKIDQIMTRVMGTADSLFLGEFLLHAFAGQLGLRGELDKVLEEKGAKSRQLKLFHWLINTRVLWPFSKRKLTRHFEHSCFKLLTSKPEPNEIYAVMDLIDSPEEMFQQYARVVFSKLGYTHAWTYFDTTTIYFFSDYDDLRCKAFAKDGKRGLPNVKLSLSCTEDYLPLTYKVFPGNRHDSTCFKDFLNRIEGDPVFKDKVLAFDAGCYSLEIIQQLEDDGYRYLCSADITKYTLIDEPRTVQIHEQNWTVQAGRYEGRRVLVAINDENHRKALEKLDRQIARVNDFAREVTGRTPASRQKKVQDLISGLGLKQLLSVECGEQGEFLQVVINQKKLLKRREKLRKIVLVTNLDKSTASGTLLEQYLGRSDVERVYRYLKSPLELRPVYHSNHPRIHAHFFIVMLGYLHLTALRCFLKTTRGLALTLEQLLEDLAYSTVINLEPKPGKHITYLGRQQPWIWQLAIDWCLPFKNGTEDGVNAKIVPDGFGHAP